MTETKRIKIVLVGESGVGKTNLIQVAIGNPFRNNLETTIFNSFYENDIIINNEKYKYVLWDTAGQEVYRSLNKLFIKESKIVIVVFAIDDRKSFDEVDFWVNYVKDILGEEKYILALVGNKSDLYEEQEVSEDEIKKKGEGIKAEVKITSAAKDAFGFRKFLNILLEEYINKIEIHEDRKESFSLKSKKYEENEEAENDGIGNKKKKKCC